MIVFYLLFLIFLLYINTFKNIPQEQYVKKGIYFVIMLDVLFSILNIFYYKCYIHTAKYIAQCLIIGYFLACKLYSGVKSNNLCHTHVMLIFYKPKKLKQMLLSVFGLSFGSAGAVIYNKDEDEYYIYQMRYENKTLQKIKLDRKKIESFRQKYLIIKSDVRVDNLKAGWEERLLKEKARQLRTLYFRFNCLWSLKKEILDLSDKFKFRYEIFPSIYLLRLKLRGIINNGKK